MVRSNMDKKLLLKLSIGAAWIDGVIQPEERQLLRKIAKENNLESDPEIQKLLSEIVAVKPEECYSWLEKYLGENPTEEDYQGLLAQISALIYSDGDVDTREAKLLAKLQLSDPHNETPKSIFDKLLAKIRQVYRQAMQEQV
jgi:uncharacterized tellurite resistance protein B-like protein